MNSSKLQKDFSKMTQHEKDVYSVLTNGEKNTLFWRKEVKDLKREIASLKKKALKEKDFKKWENLTFEREAKEKLLKTTLEEKKEILERRLSLPDWA